MTKSHYQLTEVCLLLFVTKHFCKSNLEQNTTILQHTQLSDILTHNQHLQGINVLEIERILSRKVKP